LFAQQFQIANTFEQDALGQDQNQRVQSINIAPGYVHIFNNSTVLTVNPYYRLDQVNYYPSGNPFNDQQRPSASSDVWPMRESAPMFRM